MKKSAGIILACLIVCGLALAACGVNPDGEYELKKIAFKKTGESSVVLNIGSLTAAQEKEHIGILKLYDLKIKIQGGEIKAGEETQRFKIEGDKLILEDDEFGDKLEVRVKGGELIYTFMNYEQYEKFEIVFKKM